MLYFKGVFAVKVIKCVLVTNNTQTQFMDVEIGNVINVLLFVRPRIVVVLF